MSDTEKWAALLASSMTPTPPVPRGMSGGGDPLSAVLAQQQGPPELPQPANPPGGDPMMQMIAQMNLSRREEPLPPKRENRFKAAMGRFFQGFSDELTRPEREFQEQKRINESLIAQREAMTKQASDTVDVPMDDGQVVPIPKKDLHRIVVEHIKAQAGQKRTETAAQGAMARTEVQEEGRNQRSADNLKLRREKMDADIARDKARTAIMERRMNLPQGSLIAEVDGEGEFTGRFYNNKTGSIVTNEALAGGRRTQEPEAVRQRRERIASTKNTIANIRKHSEALGRGEDILKNASLLRSQMAYFGQIAKQLGGEVGVLTKEDVARIGLAVPGIVESLLAGPSDTFRAIVQAKIEGLEDVFAKVIAARDDVKTNNKPAPRKGWEPVP